MDVTDKGNGLGGKQCAQQSRTAGLGFGEQPAQIVDNVISSVMIIQPPTGLCPTMRGGLRCSSP